MNKVISDIQESLAAALNAMPDVFSTVQWGGRAYKLPRPGSRGRKKPVLLTHIVIPKTRDAVHLGFRLPVPRAKAVVKQHRFIRPSTFGTLGKSGWLEMALTTKSQCKVVIALLKESRGLHPVSQADAAPAAPKSARRRKRGSDAGGDDGITNRMDAVLRRKREEGWKPQPGAFDD
jgi:hypothetical protein